jgi:hypothetical protein
MSRGNFLSLKEKNKPHQHPAAKPRTYLQESSQSHRQHHTSDHATPVQIRRQANRILSFPTCSASHFHSTSLSRTRAAQGERGGGETGRGGGRREEGVCVGAQGEHEGRAEGDFYDHGQKIVSMTTLSGL